MVFLHFSTLDSKINEAYQIAFVSHWRLVHSEKAPDSSKREELLRDEKTYQKLKSDPSNEFKKEFLSNVKDMNDRIVINHALLMKLYPTVDQPPRFYDLPKLHTSSMPMRPIESTIGTISCQCASYMVTVLSPVVGKTEHHVRNSKYFAKEVHKLKIAPDEELRLYDVSALFTSVPVDRALVVIKDRRVNDGKLAYRTKTKLTDCNHHSVCLIH